jgi:hypothetical protein
MLGLAGEGGVWGLHEPNCWPGPPRCGTMPAMRIPLATLRSAALLAAVVVLSACNGACPSQGLVDLGEAIRDDDGDNWFTNDTNQRVVLTLESLSLPQVGNYSVVVGDVRFPVTNSLEGTFEATSSNQVISPNIVVARQHVGTWLVDAPNQEMTFRTSVRVRSAVGPGPDEMTREVEYHNRDEVIDVIFPRSAGNDVVARFRVQMTTFADPTPDAADGDADQDGITDAEEAALAARNQGMGNPGARDLVMLVGYTHADWALTPLSRELLATRFRQRGINLRIVTAREDPLSVGFGERVTSDGAFLPRDHAITIEEARDMYQTHVIGMARNYVHFLVLAEKLQNGFWGQADWPGRVLIAQSHFPLLGPDIHQYQAKDVMHELGHNLGLCHPTESAPSDDCPSGSIPVAERDGGASVMGTPAEEANFIGVIANALARPLDYSPGQWDNANLTMVRP